MKSVNKLTWLGYLKTIKCDTQIGNQFKLPDLSNLINVKSLQPFSSFGLPYIYLLDYSSGKYIYMSDSLAGYKSEVYKKEGLDHTLEIYRPDHLRLLDKEIFSDRLSILESIRPAEHQNYLFSYNHCLKNSRGEEEHFIQRNFFISDTFGKPLYSMGILNNVSHYINKRSVIQTVEKIDPNGFNVNEIIHKKIYYLNEEDKLFTKKEKEVLCLMADGLSSKMIADKLFISENTVINHRRNMQEKSNMPNAVALVSFALREGII